MSAKNLVVFVSFALVAISCSQQKEFHDDKLGTVTKVYKAAILSSAQTRHYAFSDMLTFVRVEKNGDAVLEFKGPDKIYEVRGREWSDLKLPLNYDAALEFKLRSVSYEKQQVEIEYRAWSSELLQ